MKKILAAVLVVSVVTIYGCKLIKGISNPVETQGDLIIVIDKDDDTSKGTLSTGGGTNTSNSYLI